MRKRAASNLADEGSEETQKKPKKLKVGYYFEKYNDMKPSNLTFKVIDGIRYLDPYWSAFGCYAKGRWIGREVSEVFVTEFIGLNKYYPKAAIRMGRVFVNEKQMTDPNYKLRNNDRIIHLGIILADTERWLRDWSAEDNAQDYWLESVSQARQDHFWGTHFRQRPKYRHGIQKAIEANKLKKEYICKVDGIFPDGDVECREPIGILSKSMGIQCIREDGKKSVSTFTRLYANESDNTSIVRVRIETGRTHQIRVHLQYLGYPIIGDKFYNDLVWGPEKGKSAAYGKSLEELQVAVQDRHTVSVWHENEDPEYEKHLEKISSNPTQQPEQIDLEKLCLDDLPLKDSICLGCHVTKRLPEVDYFGLKLHCWRYKGMTGNSKHLCRNGLDIRETIRMNNQKSSL
uniref:Pseudouridine synthase RsuA/RluA-like domain-containing protein n=1 Tax=Ditylenchus dipsaci TaxID=166011 RepID=A0A915EQT1_9BILA